MVGGGVGCVGWLEGWVGGAAVNGVGVLVMVGTKRDECRIEGERQRQGGDGVEAGGQSSKDYLSHRFFIVGCQVKEAHLQKLILEG